MSINAQTNSVISLQLFLTWHEHVSMVELNLFCNIVYWVFFSDWSAGSPFAK